MTEKVTADTILDFLITQTKEKKRISRDVWLDCAFTLNLLGQDEQNKLEDMRSQVAKRRISILQGQAKRNVAAAVLEIEASDEYRDMRKQEHKCDMISEFVRIAKKNADTQY